MTPEAPKTRAVRPGVGADVVDAMVDRKFLSIQQSRGARDSRSSESFDRIAEEVERNKPFPLRSAEVPTSSSPTITI